MKLAFAVRIRPESTNNLYASKVVRTRGGRYVPKRFSKPEGEGYKRAIIDAALDAADHVGWDLGYTGAASVTIIDWRPNARGLDWDNIPKALQDALCPQIVKNDRSIWHGQVVIATDDGDPRVVVVIERTTKERIRETALMLSEGL